MGSVDNGLEMKLWVFSICPAERNDLATLAPERDVFALLATIFLPVNAIPFPGLKTLLATSYTNLYPRMTCLVAAADSSDISRHSLSPVPCEKSHHCDTWKTNCRPSGKRVVVRHCLPHRPPRLRSREIE